MYKHSESLERKAIRKKEKLVRVICSLFLLAFFVSCELNSVNQFFNILSDKHKQRMDRIRDFGLILVTLAIYLTLTIALFKFYWYDFK